MPSQRSRIAFAWYVGKSGSVEKISAIRLRNSPIWAQRTTSTTVGTLRISVSWDGNSDDVASDAETFTLSHDGTEMIMRSTSSETESEISVGFLPASRSVRAASMEAWISSNSARTSGRSSGNSGTCENLLTTGTSSFAACMIPSSPEKSDTAEIMSSSSPDAFPHSPVSSLRGASYGHVGRFVVIGGFRIF